MSHLFIKIAKTNHFCQRFKFVSNAYLDVCPELEVDGADILVVDAVDVEVEGVVHHLKQVRRRGEKQCACAQCCHVCQAHQEVENVTAISRISLPD